MSRARRHSATSSCTWSAEKRAPEEIQSHHTSFTCWPITDRVTRKEQTAGPPRDSPVIPARNLSAVAFGGAVGEVPLLWSPGARTVGQWSSRAEWCCRFSGSSVEAARLCVYTHAIGCRDERASGGGWGRGFEGLARSIRSGDGDRRWWWRWRSRWAAAMVMILEMIKTVGTWQMPWWKHVFNTVQHSITATTLTCLFDQFYSSWNPTEKWKGTKR